MERPKPWSEVSGEPPRRPPGPSGPNREWVTGRTDHTVAERAGLVTIGELASALGRRPRTVRQWELLGILPPAPFRTRSKDHRARRRLYSADHLSGLVRIAAEEGILYGKPADISRTDFARRAGRLYERLAAEAARPLSPGRRPA